MAPHKSFFRVVTSILVHLLFTPQASAAVTPTSFLNGRSALAHKSGTCSPDYVWTVIKPISTLGATCCPDGYRGEQAKIMGDLAGVFCCPEDGEEVPCEEEDRKMPTTPETCPNPGVVVGALCMKYYW